MNEGVRATAVLGLTMMLGGAGCGERPVTGDDARAGADARDAADAGTVVDAGGVMDASADADSPTDAGSLADAGTDAGWYGFRACGPPSNATLPVTPAFPLEDGSFAPVVGITAPRDLSFDGRGSMVVSGRDGAGVTPGVYLVSSTGAVRRLYSAMQGNIAGARFLAGGTLVLAGSYQSGPSVIPGISTVDGAGMPTGRLAFARGFPWGVLATPDGGFIIFDSTVERQIVRFPSALLPGSVPTPVDVSMAVGAAPTQQRAGAFAADDRHLFVVSQDDSAIHEYALSAAGVIDGASRRAYATLPATAFPRSLAFDECGNLYVNGTVQPMGGPATGALWRVPAGGGAPALLATIEPVDSQRVIAFGAGPGFSNTHLYLADAHPQTIRRVNIGIAGQPVVTP